MKRCVGNPHRRGGHLPIGCRPGLAECGVDDRGPDQDAGTSANESARPEDEGIGTNDAPQGGGLDRALALGPDPGQPGRYPEPRPGDPSTRHPFDHDLADRQEAQARQPARRRAVLRHCPDRSASRHLPPRRADRPRSAGARRSRSKTPRHRSWRGWTWRSRGKPRPRGKRIAGPRRWRRRGRHRPPNPSGGNAGRCSSVSRWPR